MLLGLNTFKFGLVSQSLFESRSYLAGSPYKYMVELSCAEYVVDNTVPALIPAYIPK